MEAASFRAASTAPSGSGISRQGSRWASAAIIETHQEWGWPALSPNGKWLVTIGPTDQLHDDSEAESAQVWDLVSRKRRFHLIHKNKALPPAFSPDGKFFVLGG